MNKFTTSIEAKLARYRALFVNLGEDAPQSPSLSKTNQVSFSPC